MFSQCFQKGPHFWDPKSGGLEWNVRGLTFSFSFFFAFCFYAFCFFAFCFWDSVIVHSVFVHSVFVLSVFVRSVFEFFFWYSVCFILFFCNFCDFLQLFPTFVDFSQLKTTLKKKNLSYWREVSVKPLLGFTCFFLASVFFGERQKKSLRYLGWFAMVFDIPLKTFVIRIDTMVDNSRANADIIRANPLFRLLAGGVVGKSLFLSFFLPHSFQPTALKRQFARIISALARIS